MLSVSAMFIGMRNGHQRRQIEDELAETAQVDTSAITTETLRCLKNSQGLVAERHCCRTRRRSQGSQATIMSYLACRGDQCGRHGLEGSI